jgi:hypothetical protein
VAVHDSSWAVFCRSQFGITPTDRYRPLQAVASDCYRAATMTADEALGSGQ